MENTNDSPPIPHDLSRPNLLLHRLHQERGPREISGHLGGAVYPAAISRAIAGEGANEQEIVRLGVLLMRIEVLVGMIASGKSTYARKRADEGALVISHDALTEMLHASYRYEESLWQAYRTMEESIAFNCLSAGRDVVIDRTHLTHESRQRWIKLRDNYVSLNTFNGREPQVSIVAVVFPVEAPAIHARRRELHDDRGRSYDEWFKVAAHHYRQIQSEPIGIYEGFDEIIHKCSGDSS